MEPNESGALLLTMRESLSQILKRKQIFRNKQRKVKFSKSSLNSFLITIVRNNFEPNEIILGSAIRDWPIFYNVFFLSLCGSVCYQKSGVTEFLWVRNTQFIIF